MDGYMGTGVDGDLRSVAIDMWLVIVAEFYTWWCYCYYCHIIIYQSMDNLPLVE